MHSITKKICLVMLILAFMVSANSFAVQAATNKTTKDTQAADELWKSAHDSFNKSKFKIAHDLFQKFSLRYHKDSRRKDALYYQGLCEMKMGQGTSAMYTWKQLVMMEAREKTRSKALLLALEQMIQYCDQKGDKRQKEKLLKQLLRDFPDSPVTVRVFVKLAQRRLEASDYARAKTLYESMRTKLSPEDQKNLELAVTMSSQGSWKPKQLLDYANKSLEEDNVKLALKLYRTFQRDFPKSSLVGEVRTKLGWCYYINREYGKAEKLWKTVISKRGVKDDWVAKSRWHMIMLNAGPYGKVDEAIKLCEIQAKEFRGEFYEEQALFSRAWLYWTQKKWVKAKSAFDDLIKAYPAKAEHAPIQEYISDCEKGIR